MYKITVEIKPSVPETEAQSLINKIMDAVTFFENRQTKKAVNYKIEKLEK